MAIKTLTILEQWSPALGQRLPVSIKHHLCKAFTLQDAGGYRWGLVPERLKKMFFQGLILGFCLVR